MRITLTYAIIATIVVIILAVLLGVYINLYRKEKKNPSSCPACPVCPTCPESSKQFNFVTGRYVQVGWKDGTAGVLQIAEIELFDENFMPILYNDVHFSPEDEKLRNATDTYAKEYGKFAASNVNNGNYNSFSFSYNNPPIPNNYIEIDIGSEKKISDIMIYNRQDKEQDKIIGAVVTILDANKKVVYTSEKIAQGSSELIIHPPRKEVVYS